MEQLKIPKFKKKDIPKLKYGVIHSQFGYPDGVSIVMRQIEEVMVKQLGVPLKNINYLVGRSKNKTSHVHVERKLWMEDRVNKIMLRYFNIGYGGFRSEQIEIAINQAKGLIADFVKTHKIDVIIAHNASHPVNFIMSVALSRFYRDRVKKKQKTPKYILWWHDSHLERKSFSQPAYDVWRYLLQGVPGRFVEYIVFINSLQFTLAENYFKHLNKIRPGFFEDIHKNYAVIYNTADIFIDSYRDLISDRYSDRIEQFIEDFKIRKLLKKNNLTLSQVLFCLQHTRILDRKRIDFALKYCFELLKRKKETGKHTKALYFLVSGHKADNSKQKLKKLYSELMKEYNNPKLFLVFAEDYDGRTDIKFEEYPIIFAKLRGFSTYFSEIEGFGNNLLEVLASGLIPVVYTYPVFKVDIEKNGFKLCALDKFEITKKDIDATLDILRNDKKRRRWVNKNLEILRKSFQHNIIALKLSRAIIRKRMHK